MEQILKGTLSNKLVIMQGVKLFYLLGLILNLNISSIPLMNDKLNSAYNWFEYDAYVIHLEGTNASVYFQVEDQPSSKLYYKIAEYSGNDDLNFNPIKSGILWLDFTIDFIDLNECLSGAIINLYSETGHVIIAKHAKECHFNFAVESTLIEKGIASFVGYDDISFPLLYPSQSLKISLRMIPIDYEFIRTDLLEIKTEEGRLYKMQNGQKVFLRKVGS